MPGRRRGPPPAPRRTTANPLSFGDLFPGEFRAAVGYHHRFAEPIDDTMFQSANWML